MQIDFNVAVIGADEKDQQADPEKAEEPVVAANDNGVRWPLIPFPEGWYASS